MKDQKDDQAKEVENLEVEPLTDEDLESVPGGLGSFETIGDACSCKDTGGNCTS